MPAPVTHFLPLTAIRRARLLPVPGRVLVRSGQQVTATDSIADTYLPEQHVLLDVRRALGVSTARAESLIERREGEKVQKGDVIAETGGPFSRVVRSPVNGTVVSLANGQVWIEVQGQPLVVRAAMPGTVTDIVQDRGAIIQVTGSLVQGVWGNGRIDMGLMLAAAQSPDEEITREKLDVSMRGAVVLAGYCARADALQAAASLPLRGLVLGSMSPELTGLAGELKFPLMLTDGFGRIPMNSAAFKLLSTSDKRDIAINAVGWDRMKGERPEAVIPLPAAAERAQETDEFQVGQIVRVQGAPYTGQLGTVMLVHPGIALLATGLRAQAADVRLENGERMTMPLANLDVLE